MLGEQFNIDHSKAIPNKDNIISGTNYRFTILSERLIRLEYNENGVFENRPTELVWYRNMNKVPFQIKEDSKFLEIQTSYFKLTYVKEKPFKGTKLNAMANLKVELLNSDRIWYYGNPEATEARNYGSPGLSLDDTKKLKLKMGLYSPYGYAYLDDSNGMIMNENGTLKAREEQSIDIYLFMYLKDFALCLKDYYAITGYPSLIPRYALGNWWSRNVAYDDDSLKELVTTFEDKKIPLSVLLLDKDWHINTFEDKQMDSGFTWNTEKFKSPKGMIDYMHAKGVRVGLSVNPKDGFYPYEKYYDNIKKYIPAGEKGIIPFNVYDDRTIEVYMKILIDPLDQYGVDFYWIDDDGKKDLNRIWALSHYHFTDLKEDYKRRAMVLSRNSGIAAHRYPVLYSGKTIVSWDTLNLIPLHNSSATNIGVSFWAHDIGGYYKGKEDNELYQRYVQLGTFSPILKFGSDKGKYYKREPWRWSIKTYEIVNDYLHLRHRLIPYL